MPGQQFNFNFLQWGNDYFSINLARRAGINIGFNADQVNDRGFPLANLGVNYPNYGWEFFLPTQIERPGNYVVLIDGAGQLGFQVSWLNGANGTYNGPTRLMFTGPGLNNNGGRTNPGFWWSSVTAPSTYLVVMHQDDEAAWNAGKRMTPIYQSVMSSLTNSEDLIIARHMVWGGLANGSHTLNISDLTDEESFGWTQKPLKQPQYTSGGTAYNYTLTVPSINGNAIPDNTRIRVKWNVSSPRIDQNSAVFLSLNGGSTHKIYEASLYTPVNFNDYTGTINANEEAMLIYKAIGVGIWLWTKGWYGAHEGPSLAEIKQFHTELGTPKITPWLNIPHLAADSNTSTFTFDLATWAKNNITQTKTIFELCNEWWNSAHGGFGQTRWGWLSENLRGNTASAADIASRPDRAFYGNFDSHESYSRSLAKIGKIISDVYQGDTSRYEIICAIQTLGGTDARRLDFTDAEIILPAKTYVTAVSCAPYWNSKIFSNALESQLATEWQLATPARKTEIINRIVTENTLDEGYVLYKQCYIFGSSRGITKMYGYEGGYSPDFMYGGGWNNDQNALDMNIISITKGATTVVRATQYGVHPAAGLNVVLHVTNTTEINDGTPVSILSVVAVSGSGEEVIYDITINLNTVNISGTPSGGVITIKELKRVINELRYASKFAPMISAIQLMNDNNFKAAGGTAPSRLNLTGDGDPWTHLSPSSFAGTTLPTTPSYESMKRWAAGTDVRKPVRTIWGF